MFRFKCKSCGGWHEGMPTFGARAPLFFYTIPARERSTRCVLTSDTCVVDRQYFFILGGLDIPVIGASEPFVWNVWVALDQENYDKFMQYYHRTARSHIKPFPGFLSAELPLYPSTENLRVRVQLRDDGVRPYVELDASKHPLAMEQRNGISADRVAEFYAYYEHRVR